MKKFLSLVLALVMTMSLVTISAGAEDFTDAEDITYVEAVEVLTAIDVVTGYTDGSFKPETALNRGQAAKIICNLILGPTVAGALVADTAPFKDVPANHTFAGYIAYCVQQGIISGYTDGTFKPEKPLTGYAFMKMLLGALGYDADVEGFNQPNWSIQVAKTALGAGLNKGLVDDFNGVDSVTREEACLYALNTLKADIVAYDAKTNISVGDATISIGSKAEKVPQANSGYVDTTGDAAAVVQFMEKHFPKLSLEVGPGPLGRKSDTWTFKNKQIGIYETEDALLTYTADKSNTAGKTEITKALKGYDLTAATLYRNGYEAATGVTAAEIAEYTGNGILVEVYNDGTDITSVVVIESYVGQVTKVNTTEETITIKLLATGNSYTTAAGYDVFEKDEYVMVSPVYSAATTISSNAADRDDATVTSLEKVTGVVQTATSSKVVLADGTYKIAELNDYSAPAAKDETDVYLDQYGYVQFTSKVSVTDLVYLVWKDDTLTDDFGDTVETVQVVGVDGKGKVYELNSASPLAYSAITVGELYGYRISGNKISLSTPSLASTSAKGYVTYTSSATITSSDNHLEVDTDGGRRFFSDETIFISIAGSKGDLEVTVSTGKQLVTNSADYAVISAAKKESNESTDAAVIFLNQPMTSTSVSNLIMAIDGTADGWDELNGTDYDTYEVYLDGEKLTIPVDTATGVSPVAGCFYSYTKNSDGAYVLTDRSTNVEENVTLDDVYKNWITTDSTDVWDAADAKIVDTTDLGNNIADLTDLKTLFDIDGAEITVSMTVNADEEALIIYIVAAETAYTVSSTTYTLNSTLATSDDFQSISYKNDGTTCTTTATEFEADGTVTSVKVSTVGGLTLAGYDAT